jgi:hypothetical protein
MKVSEKPYASFFVLEEPAVFIFRVDRYRRFGETCCVHLQGETTWRHISEYRNLDTPVTTSDVTDFDQFLIAVFLTRNCLVKLNLTPVGHMNYNCYFTELRIFCFELLENR